VSGHAGLCVCLIVGSFVVGCCYVLYTESVFIAWCWSSCECECALCVYVCVGVLLCVCVFVCVRG